MKGRKREDRFPSGGGGRGGGGVSGGVADCPQEIDNTKTREGSMLCLLFKKVAWERTKVCLADRKTGLHQC